MASLRGVLTGLRPSSWFGGSEYGATSLGLSNSPLGLVVNEDTSELVYESTDGSLIVDDSSAYVGASGADKFEAVATCVRVVSDAVRAVPFYSANADGQPVDTVLEDIIQSPNVTTRWATLLDQLVRDYLLWGDAYLMVIRSGRIPIAVWHLPAYMVDSVRYDHEVQSVIYQVQGHAFVNPPGEPINIAHFIRQPRPSFPPRGTSVVQSLAGVVGHGLSADSYAQNLAINGRQAYALKVPHELNDSQKKALSDGWRKVTRGVKTRNTTPILEGGVEPVPLGMSTVDMDMLEHLKLDRTRIAAAFGCPAIVIGDLSKATFSNAAQQDRAFVKYAVLPIVNEFRDVLHRALLDGMPELQIEYDLDALTRAEPLLLAKQKQIEVQVGIRSPKEAAEDMGYDWDESEHPPEPKPEPEQPDEPVVDTDNQGSVD